MATNEAPPPESPKASIAQVKSIIRRRRRKIEDHMEQSINLYPMMDMMVILLVFLIKSFSSATTNATQDADLLIPYSTSETETGTALVLQITRNAIVVEGRRVVSLRNGIVDPSQKQGGAQGFLIPALLRLMEQHRDRLRRMQALNARHRFTGELQIIGDRRTPFRTVSEVLYTVGQAEFAQYRFVLLKQGT